MRKIGESIKGERLKFKKGLQREFLIKIKEKSSLTWKELANRLDICEHTIMFDWKNERATLPYKTCKKLIKMYPIERFEIIKSQWAEKILPESWGQKMVGEKLKKKIVYPKNSEDLAEILGIILGDGHLERKTLTITGNLNEKLYYLYLIRKIKKLFSLESKIFRLKNQNAIQLKAHSTELIKYLIKNRMVMGNKINNKASLPKWIFKENKFIFATLRGLFDTDGGIYEKQKRYKRAIIEFQNHSPYIKKDIIMMLKKIGFNPSKSALNIRIQNQNEVSRFMCLVGSANPKNIVRYRYFIKEGFIPVKKNLKKDIRNFKENLPFHAALV